MDDVVDDNLFTDRLIAMLSGCFAALATLLAATGLYGVLAYSVAQRTRELGLRLALGATASGLRAMVMRQVATIALIGMPIGLALGVALGQAAEVAAVRPTGLRPVRARRRGRRARGASCSRPATCRPGARRASRRWKRCGTSRARHSQRFEKDIHRIRRQCDEHTDDRSRNDRDDQTPPR